MKGAPAEVVLGPALIGTLLNVFLFGTLVVQTYIYFTTYKRTVSQIIVLLIADIFNTFCDTISIYEYLIKHFGDKEYHPATGIIAMTVQLFFTWRIYVLTKSWIMSFIVISLSITGAVASFISAHRTVIAPEFVRFQESNGVVAVWLGSSAAADIVITCILRKHRTGFKGSDMMIDRLIRITMQTGLLTSMTAIVNIVLFVADVRNICIPHHILYSNSLLSSLNARGGWKYEDGVSSLGTNTIATLRFANLSHTHLEPKSLSVIANGSQQQIKVGNLSDTRVKHEVHIHVESYEQRDAII
ncbi:hypothetical protein P691DRAFT_798252 [Macrolepiota fuliginosa MF-IS2]|uniref:DUF6534 domain-containing protein n=1 Tax=Macrolepiota fuliginosa MF-IS2 TaxID=1400762 RepID=A0A9P6BYA7_9AGAR|nr:hypothetical protein P691DRAFT_798252 [Macrolepiota fuliginosa MF-IS2]